MAIITVVTGLSLFTFSNPVVAQESRQIFLHDAIQTALDSNLIIRSAGFSVDVSKKLKGNALDLPKTSFEGQYGQINSFSKDNSFTISQSFAFPTVYANRFKLANANITSSEINQTVVRLEISSQVKLWYWQYVYLLSKQKLLSYQDSLYAGFLRAAELRSKAGETNRLEMITARSQSLEIKNQLFQISSDLEITARKLMLILNTSIQIIPADTELRLIYESIQEDTLSIEGNPSLKLIKQQVEIARLEKKVQQSQTLPDLSIGYFNQSMIGTQDVNGSQQTFGGGDRFSGVQAGISVPLWFPAYTSKNKAATIYYEKSQTDAENYSKSVSGSLKSLLDEFRKFSASVNYYESQAVPEADLIIDQASKSYKAGALDYLDFVLTLNRALTIKQNYLDALNNCNQTLISIDFVTGKIF
jgi:cobalt-zinc-cadmium resistance protein CzcA